MKSQGQGRRLLFLDLLVPEPDRHASSVRAAQLLALLVGWGWQIDFLAVAQDQVPVDPRALENLGVTLLPWLPDGALEAFVGRILPRYDVVYMAWTLTARRLLPVLEAAAERPPLIFDTHDVNHRREFREARLSGNARTLARSLRTKENELRAIRVADVALTITDADRDYLRPLVPQAAIHTVEMWAEPRDLPRRPEPATLLFIGNMGAPHNHDCAIFLVQEVMPLLRPHLPALRLVLVGQEPHRLVRNLAAPDVEIAGWVADLDDWLARASLLLAPLRFGSGLKGKMLQAMANGLPIVASAIAAEGMPLRNEQDVLLAEGPVAIASAVRRLLADRSLGARLAEGARDTLLRHYGRDRIAAQLAQAIEAIR